ncbi:MAG: hypothetical protein ABI302_06065 [Lacisediminihabitans sp.]
MFHRPFIADCQRPLQLCIILRLATAVDTENRGASGDQIADAGDELDDGIRLLGVSDNCGNTNALQNS